MASSPRAESNRTAFDPWRRSLPTSTYVSISRKSCLSVRYQIDHRPSSPSPPGRSILVEKKKSNNNTVSLKQKKWCMCSPTTHPGSFRCSLHKTSNPTYSKGEQERNEIKNNNSGSKTDTHSLNLRRSAMTKSLVRIGGVEGTDLLQKSLSALITPSSHQQRRRSEFRPRPSRLSVMSKAEEEED